MDRYYKLYFNFKELKIKITLMKENDCFYKVALERCSEKNTLFKYNDCYYICNNRKQLKALALEIQTEWIDDLKDKIYKIKYHNKI